MSSIEKVERVVTGDNAFSDDCENASNKPKATSPLQQLEQNEQQPQRHHLPRIVKSASQGSSQPGLQHTGTPEHMRGATKDMFDLIERAQCSRLDDQRCVLPAYFSQDWVPTLHSFESNCSQPDLLRIDVRSVRKSKGIYALNGTAYLGVDLDETFFGEVNIYRSGDGSGQYKATPYKIPKTPFYKFMTMIYVKMIQKGFAPCSNLPQYAKAFDSPWKAGHFYINMCTFDTEGMPGHVQPGYYKAIGQVTRDDIHIWITVTFKVEPKSLGT